eukprot:TRINITY_DN4028_c0_g1_i1.p1 TRINITY_DN4028_c0_g1~~TRINITY_DN4028_c0_g1_i1.p1  ORF type:complete len:392 (-),score=85.40 TRINITY_DN4028_c0_g1_i1:57-1232(-)
MGKNSIHIYVPDCVYYGGDVVCGVAELKVEGTLKSRGVRLLFAGYEYTNWSTGAGKHRRTHSETHVFLKHRWDFAGTARHLRKEKDAQVDILETGVYRWPFSVVLPPNVPASCALTHGFICYKVTVYVDIPMAIDLKKSVGIAVGGELFTRGFYTIPSLPLSLSDHKTFLFASGDLAMTATVPRQNWFAEEVIPIHLSVKNDSTKEVETIKVQLCAKYHYVAHGSTESDTIEPSEWKQTIDHKIEKKSNLEIDLQYKLPKITPTVEDCSNKGVGWHVRLITISYFLRVRLDVPWAIDLDVSFPVRVMLLNPRYPIYYIPSQAPMVYAPPPSPIPQIFAPPPQGQIFGPPPPSSAPAVPSIDNYQYPTDNAAVIVELGSHVVDPDDEALLNN